MAKTIPHFINGKTVEGKSGRFGDVFNPATGEIAGRVALASAAEVERGGRRRGQGLSGLGGDPAAAPRARHVQVQGAARGATSTSSRRSSPPSTARC